MSGYDNYSEYELFYDKENYYFKVFPYVEYDIKGDGNSVKIKNFLKRFDFLELVRLNKSSFIKWIIRDEDTPEIIAHKMYGSEHFYWIILIMNRISNPIFSWPMVSKDLHKYIVKKYGEENIYNTHHYESIDTGDEYDLPDGVIVDENYTNKIAITNYDYELKINDKNREIIILKNDYLYLVRNEWNTIESTKFNKVR